MAASPLTIKLRCTSWQQVSALYERDLLRSGLFLKSAAPPPVGTPVRINLTLPTQTLIVLNGSIVTHVEKGGLQGRGPGVDIKLRSVPHSALWLIESALNSARQSGDLREPQQQTRAEMESDDRLVDAEKELIQALQSEFNAMRTLNPFQVLGVDQASTDQEVRAAFAVLTKRFHPDRYTRYESREAHRLAAEIFILVRNAYQHLDSPAKRAHTHGVLRRRRAAARQSGRAAHSGRPLHSASDLPTPPPGREMPGRQVPGQQVPGRQVPGQQVPDDPDDPTNQIAHHPRTVGRPGQPRTNSSGRPVASNSEPSAAPVSAPAKPASDQASAPAPSASAPASATPKQSDVDRAYALLDAGQAEDARKIFKLASVRNPGDKRTRIGLELAEGLVALAGRDRLEAAQRFEVVLELDPNNERAARILADMRRQATAERKNHMARLLGQK